MFLRFAHPLLPATNLFRIVLSPPLRGIRMKWEHLRANVDECRTQSRIRHTLLCTASVPSIRWRHGTCLWCPCFSCVPLACANAAFCSLVGRNPLKTHETIAYICFLAIYVRHSKSPIFQPACDCESMVSLTVPAVSQAVCSMPDCYFGHGRVLAYIRGPVSGFRRVFQSDLRREYLNISSFLSHIHPTRQPRLAL